MRHTIRFLLITIGFALTSYGLLSWQAVGFSLKGLWFDDGLRLHPLHILAFGIALVPPAIWELFLLDQHENNE